MKKSIWMSLVVASVMVGVPVLSACSVEAGDGKEEVSATGTVSMALSTVTPSGTTYRLSNALFTIEGPTTTQLASNDDPMQSVLTAVLATGDYLSTLENGWILQRDDGMGFVNVSATLVSGNPATFSVFDGQRTDLVYQFNTDGTIITIGTGELGISIQVNETGTGGTCEAFGAGCAPGEWCVPGSLTGGEPLCVVSGTTPIGADCVEPTECVTNALCGSIDGGTIGTCLELCPPNFGAMCSTGLVCSQIDGFTDFGACL